MQRHVLLALLTCSLMLLRGHSALAQLVASPDTAESTSENNAPYYDLGGFHRAVTTNSQQAQTWFDRGLAMCFAFNHEEAVRCFEHALSADPGMPMALWGMAYAWGPNINNLEIEPHQIAQAGLATRLAKIQAKGATQLERELIEALELRYAVPVPDNREPLNQAYARAMRNRHKQNPDDSLVATLCAESLMILRPWKHWSPDGKA